MELLENPSQPISLPPPVYFPLRKKTWRERLGSFLRFPFKPRRRRWIFFGVLFVLFFFLALPIGAMAYLFFQTRNFPALGVELNNAISSQDLPRIETVLGAINSQLGKAETAF